MWCSTWLMYHYLLLTVRLPHVIQCGWHKLSWVRHWSTCSPGNLIKSITRLNCTIFTNLSSIPIVIHFVFTFYTTGPISFRLLLFQLYRNITQIPFLCNIFPPGLIFLHSIYRTWSVKDIFDIHNLLLVMISDLLTYITGICRQL